MMPRPVRLNTTIMSSSVAFTLRRLGPDEEAPADAHERERPADGDRPRRDAGGLSAARERSRKADSERDRLLSQLADASEKRRIHAELERKAAHLGGIIERHVKATGEHAGTPLGKCVEDAVKNRIKVVEGGLTSALKLPKDLDLVIHSAASVSFDDPINESFEANIGGVVNLYESLRAAGGDPRVVHVSTCYVQGLRKGVAPETSLKHDIDWRAEYASAFDAHRRIETESREPHRLRAFMEVAQAEHGGPHPPRTERRATDLVRAHHPGGRAPEDGRP